MAEDNTATPVVGGADKPSMEEWQQAAEATPALNTNPQAQLDLASAAKQASEYKKRVEGQNYNPFSTTVADENGNIVQANTFETPEMGDFYLGAVDDVYLRKLDDMVNKKDDALKPGDKEKGKRAAFYTENPPCKEFGYDNKTQTSMFYVTPSTHDYEGEWLNGNTIRVRLSEIHSDANGMTDGSAKSFRKSISGNDPVFGGMDDSDCIQLSLYGIDAVYPDRYAFEKNVPADQVEIRSFTPTEVQNYPSAYTCTQDFVDGSTAAEFVHLGERWYQIERTNESDNGISFKWLVCPANGDKKDAEKASMKLKNLIKDHSPIYITIDNKTGIGGINNFQYVADDQKAINTLKTWAGNNLYGSNNGWCLAREDILGSVSGQAFIKVDGKFVNLAKAIIADPDANAQPDNTNIGNNDAFKTEYDPGEQTFADAYFAMASELDDRQKIQEEIFGKDWAELSRWTVTIGDVTLLIPPTSITVTTHTSEERVSMLRARGTMAKGGRNIEREISMDIYFYGDKGINGWKYKAKSPNGKSMTYYMDGLRALISQFKFTPFLPIENDYLNDTLGIEAVILNSINTDIITSNVCGPKLIHAILTMTEFDYAVYIPDCALFKLQSEKNINGFSAAFNWPVMRYYYQRALINGNSLLNSGLEINSKEYLKRTLQNRTALQPMSFKDSSMKFYVADPAYLEKMLNAKREKMQEQQLGINYSDDGAKAMSAIGKNAVGIEAAINSDDFQNAIKKLAGRGIHYVPVSPPARVNATTLLDHGMSPWRDLRDADGNDVHDEVDEALSTLKASIKQQCPDANVRGYERYDSQNKIFEIGACVAFNDSEGHAITEDAIENVQKNASAFTGGSQKTTYQNGRIYIPMRISIAADGSGTNFTPATDTDDMKLLSYAKDKYVNNTALPRNGSTEDSQWRKAANIDQLDNMAFVPIDAGVFYVTYYTAQIVNHMSSVNGHPISLQDSKGCAPQYLGGEDTVFKVIIHTTDRKAAGIISNLPKLSATMMRQYRQVIPCYPIKVDSEFTRFFGTTEVSITDVQVDTIPGQPGVYSISFSMRSMDRTLRQREATAMLQADNAGDRKDKNFEEKTMKSFFQVENTLARAELYPDLELPTIEDMKTLGYSYLRYKFQDDRIYVDPDFYFVYLARLSSQILRDTIMESIGEGIDGTKTYKDSTGAQYKLTAMKQKGYEAVAMNDTAKNQEKMAKNSENVKYKINAKKTLENLKKDSNYHAVEEYEGWEISNDVKAMFLEPAYTKEIKAYEANEKKREAEEKQPEEENDQKSQDQASAEEQSQNNSTDSQSSQGSAPENSSTDGGSTEGEDTPPSQEEADQQQLVTEGKWVYEQLEDAREASNEIDLYLSQNPIPVDPSNSGAIRKKYLGEKKDGGDTKTSFDMVKTAVYNGVSQFFNISEVHQIMDLLNIDVNADFLKTVKDIVYSAACAATGEKEYSSKKKSTNWMASPGFVGYVPGTTRAETTMDEDLPDAGAFYATEFGCFKIKQYSRNEFMKMTGENPDDVWSEEEKNDDLTRINTNYYLLDRYYRYQPVDTIVSYKLGCINDPLYCTHAYLRNCLYWLKVLIDRHAIPTIKTDVLRKATKAQKEVVEAEKANNLQSGEKEAELMEHITFFSRNTSTMDSGKIWAASVLASSDGNKMILDRIDDRDYRGLQEYSRGASVPSSQISTGDKTTMALRKMTMAMTGLGHIDNKDTVGVSQNEPAVQHARNETEQLYIKAADDPKQFMIHSCHDMIVHDARGRMLRAFPTYYMVFIDEGRDVGSYKLHDNFYNSMNILKFTVVKDRKNPADTATITLTNYFQSYATEGIDRLRKSEASLGDTFDSVFFPGWHNHFAKDSSSYAEQQEKKRQNASPPDKLRLRAGARIHLRAGYGSNAVMLPIIFNGSIAEVTAEDTVEIVAQGDGVELMNPILEKKEAHSLTSSGGWLSNGETPKQIMNDILTTNGGAIATVLKNLPFGFDRPDILGDNPYGIYHFGNKDFSMASSADISGSGSSSKSSEPTQNIFEAWASPNWGDDNVTNVLGIDKAPSITFDVFGKTVWDIANICKSVMPDFICAVAPFDFRSTLFIGAPRFYYAYSYGNTNGAIIEKRKPFQQYHIYTSGSDIIANGITATSQKMKTVATGLYQVCATANTKEQHTVGPLYADYDIYPEDQKSMVVDTQLLGKGVPFLGAAGLNFFTSFETVDAIVGNDEDGALTGGHNMNNKSIAWRMTASALKDSMKEMYAGDMVLLGDPTIKPHDRMYISDEYEGISGQCTAKEVVHSMSVENGFTTTVSPDLICAVDDRFEQIIASWFNMTAGFATVHLLAVAKFASAMGLFGSSPVVDAASKLKQALYPERGLEAMKNLTAKSKMATKAVENGMKIAKKVKADIDKIDSLNPIKVTQNFGEWAGKKAGTAFGSEAAGKIFGEFASKVGRNIWAGGGFSITPAGIIANLVEATLETVAVESIGSTVMNMFKKYTRNLQVLTIYPLKRYGIVWTAGVAGSMGMIYGDPSYKEQGAWTKLMNKVSGIDDDERIKNDPSSAIGAYTGSLISDPEVYKDAVAKSQRDSGMVDANGKPTSSNNLFKNTLQASYGMSTLSGNTVKQDYRRLLMTPRADYSLYDDVQTSYNYFAMQNTSNFQDDPKMKNVKMIGDDPRFRPYIKEGFFKIIHETPALNDGKYVESKILNIGGEQKYVKVMEYDLDNGDHVYDMPLLNPDAIDVLYEIIRRAKNNMPTANSSDPQESYDETQNSFIALDSALRIGDTESQAAAGFTFILHAVENATNPLVDAIIDFAQEVKQDAAESDGQLASEIFSSKKVDDQKVAIVVRMPRISNKNVAGQSSDNAYSKDAPTEEPGSDSSDSSDSSENADANETAESENSGSES